MKEMPPARRDQKIAHVLDNLRRVFKVVHRYSKHAEKVGGLTGPLLWAMKVLAESAPLRVTDLARRMVLHPSTVVGILKGRKGLSDPEHLLSPEVNVPGRKINGPENRTGEHV